MSEDNTEGTVSTRLLEIHQTLSGTGQQQTDVVNHPPHYTAHPSGVECIEITEHMSFTLGNAVKYIWRADLKNDAIEDLRKAIFYLEREVSLRERLAKAN